MKAAVTLLACLALCLGSPASADDPSLPGDLTGIGLVVVTTPGVGDDGAAIGLDGRPLETHLEAKLRSLAVPVVRAGGDPPDGAPRPTCIAELAVEAIKIDDASCAVNVSLRVRERVHPGRNAGHAQIETLWEDGLLLTGPQSTMQRRLEDNVEEMGTEFGNAWLRDNPKS